MNYRVIYKEPYLSHHGILGQKWGDRNGPPYPLGSGDHSAREKKAGWIESLRKSNVERKSRILKKIHKDRDKIRSEKDNKSKESFVEKHKDTINKIKKVVNSDEFKLAMKIAVAAVATYAVYKVGKHCLQEWGRNYLDQAYQDRALGPFKSLSDIPKTSTDYFDEVFNKGKDFSVVTKNINHGTNLDNISDAYGRNQNCTMCSASIIMKLKGMDTSASTTDHGFTSLTQGKWFENSNFETAKTSSAKSLYNKLLKQGDKNYGMLNVRWKFGGGHSIVYAIRDGKVHILDGQVNEVSAVGLDEFISYMSKCNVKDSEFANLTNCNPTDYILKALDNPYTPKNVHISSYSTSPPPIPISDYNIPDDWLDKLFSD